MIRLSVSLSCCMYIVGLNLITAYRILAQPTPTPNLKCSISIIHPVASELRRLHLKAPIRISINNASLANAINNNDYYIYYFQHSLGERDKWHFNSRPGFLTGSNFEGTIFLGRPQHPEDNQTYLFRVIVSKSKKDYIDKNHAEVMKDDLPNPIDPSCDKTIEVFRISE